MSIRAMAAVWDLPLEPTMKLLLLALADYADANGTAWPSYPTLSARVGITERQLRRLIGQAEDAGYLTRLRGGRGPGNSTRYTLAIIRRTPASPIRGTHASPSKGDMGGDKGDMGVRKRGTPTSLEPSMNRQVEPKGGNRIDTAEALRRARHEIDPRIFQH